MLELGNLLKRLNPKAGNTCQDRGNDLHYSFQTSCSYVTTNVWLFLPSAKSITPNFLITMKIKTKMYPKHFGCLREVGFSIPFFYFYSFLFRSFTKYVIKLFYKLFNICVLDKLLPHFLNSKNF